MTLNVEIKIPISVQWGDTIPRIKVGSDGEHIPDVSNSLASENFRWLDKSDATKEIFKDILAQNSIRITSRGTRDLVVNLEEGILKLQFFRTVSDSLVSDNEGSTVVMMNKTHKITLGLAETSIKISPLYLDEHTEIENSRGTKWKFEQLFFKK